MSCLVKKSPNAPALFMLWRTHTPPQLMVLNETQNCTVTMYRVPCATPGWQSGKLAGAVHRGPPES